MDESSKVQNDTKEHTKFPIHITAINPSNLCNFLGDLIEIDIVDEVRKIQNQTLIIWGGKDTLLKKVWDENHKDFLVNSQVLVMENEYHNITTVDPDFLSDTILKFMAD